MFFSGYLLCVSPGWAEAWRFARNEMYVRPGSPALTHARNTDQVCRHAATSAPSRLGPGQADPSVGHFFPAPRLWPTKHPCMSPLASGVLRASLGLWTTSRGLREKSAGSSSQTVSKGIVIITIATVETTSFFCVSCF